MENKKINFIKTKRGIGTIILVFIAMIAIIAIAATVLRVATADEIEDEKTFVRMTASLSRGKDSNNKVNIDTLAEELNKYVGTGKTTVTSKTSSIIVVKFEETGNEYEINVDKGPAFDEGQMPYIPAGFEKVDGSVDTGFVVEDEQHNQFVWIEVPKTSDVYQTAGTNIVTFTDEEMSKIENDLHTYTSIYRNGTSYKDQYPQDIVESSTGLSSGEYNELKRKMLKSVYKNGGFYIGRYETGIANSPRTASGSATQTPVIQANAYPYNYVTLSQAQTLSSTFTTPECSASLMFGVQWDLVLKYLETKGVTQSELKTDSTSWGNYYNKTYEIEGSSAKYSTNSGATWTSTPYAKNASASVLLTTGASKTFSKQNIFDIAGNVREWTLEYASNTSTPCVYRGGDFTTTTNLPASSRNSETSSFSSNYSGFRVALYKDEGKETITFTQNPATNIWTNRSVRVVASTTTTGLIFQTSKDGESWEDTDTQIFTENGTMYARLVDSQGQTLGQMTHSVTNIDTIEPTATLGTNGGKYVMPTEGKALIKTTLTVADAGGSGLDLIQYAWSTSNTIEPQTWTNFTSGETLTKSDCTVGTYYLWTNVTDIAGNRASNVMTSKPFIIKSNTDTESLITITPNITQWTNQNVIATVTYGSLLSTGKQAGYGATLSDAKSAISTSTATSVTVTANGYVYAEATDANGNKITNSIQITNIDKTLPTVSLEPNGGSYVEPTTGKATIKTKLTANDEGGSGLSTLKYAWSTSNTTEPTSWSTFTSGQTVSKTDCVPGTYYLWTYVTDFAGSRATTIKTSNAFIVKPKTDASALITITLSKDTWSNTDIIATVSYGSLLTQNKKAGYGDTLANAQTAASTSTATNVTVTANGYVYAEATDTNGNKITQSLQVTNIDKTLPTVELGSNGGTYVKPTSGNATIKTTLTAKDEGGSGLNILQYAWSTSNTEEPATWTAFTNGDIVSKTDCTVGTYYLWTKVTDIAGNRATSVRVSNAYIVKGEASSEAKITITLSTGEWVNTNITATITYGSALTDGKIAGFGTTLATAKSSASENTATSVTVTSNGYVYAEGTDDMGNTITANLQVTNIDKTLPTVSLGTNGGTFTMPTGGGNATIKTTLTAADADSQVNTLKYAWSTSNTVEPTSWSTFTNGGTVSKTDCTVGSYYLWTYVTDNAGNRADTIKTSNAYIVKAIDSTSTITITVSNTSWTNQDVTATVSYGSLLTQGKKAGYGSTLANAQTTASTSTATSVTATANGYIYAEATDTAGNKITANLQVANIDKTKPAISSVTVKSSSSLYIKATDDLSGIVGYTLTTSTTTPTSFTAVTSTKTFEITKTGLSAATEYYVWVKDAAGNISNSYTKRTCSPASVQSPTGQCWDGDEQGNGYYEYFYCESYKQIKVTMYLISTHSSINAYGWYAAYWYNAAGTKTTLFEQLYTKDDDFLEKATSKQTVTREFTYTVNANAVRYRFKSEVGGYGKVYLKIEASQ